MAVSKIFMQCNLEVNIRSSKRILKSKINNNLKGKIQVFLFGGQNFGSERTVEFFCGKLLLTETATWFYLICECRCPLAREILLREQSRTDNRRVPKNNYIF